jgi:hypothetical protein
VQFERGAVGIAFAIVARVVAEPAVVADAGGNARGVPRLVEFTAVEPAALQRGHGNLHVEKHGESVGGGERLSF